MIKWFRVIYMTFIITSTIWIDTILFPIRKKRSIIPNRDNINLNREKELEVFLLSVVNYTENPSLAKFEELVIVTKFLGDKR